ncbi:pyridoxal phosphate-dependent aminotransferase [soil metagenome]
MDTTPAELRARGGLKWTAHGPDVLAAWVAEMDFGLAPAVAAALRNAVDRGETGYFYPAIEWAAAEAAAAFWADDLSWKVSPDQVFSAPDVVEGLGRAIIHLTRPDSAVILHTPVYYPFFSMVERAGRELVEVPCQPDDGGRYRLDLDRIDSAFATGAGCLVLCNPWNPTGRSFSREEIAEVVSIAATHGGRVVSDEIHASLTHPGFEHVVAAKTDPDTVITVTSASKAWNLPGLKCAQVVLTRDSDATVWRDYYTPEKVAVGTFGLIANAAAYGEGGDWLASVRAHLASNRELLGDLIPTHLPDARYHAPEATYLAWLDFRPYGLEDPAAHFLEHSRVALTSGTPFGVNGGGHARLNFATSRHPQRDGDPNGIGVVTLGRTRTPPKCSPA